jgi:hypothetical protein
MNAILGFFIIGNTLTFCICFLETLAYSDSNNVSISRSIKPMLKTYLALFAATHIAIVGICAGLYFLI